MVLKKFFLNLRTKKSVHQNKTERLSTPFEKVQQIGILFTTGGDEKLIRVKNFAAQLTELGKSVSILEFVPKLKKNMVLSGLPWFSMKDVSTWGQINNNDENQFVRKDFDYLFLADTELHPVIYNVLARSRAHCRVGQHGAGRSSFLDLMIQIPENGQELLSEMLNYTRKLS